MSKSLPLTTLITCNKFLASFMICFQIDDVYPRAIRHLLSLSFAHGGPESDLDLKDCYLLLMNRDSLSSLVPWHGETVVVRSSTETTIAISEIEVSTFNSSVSLWSGVGELVWGLH